VERRAPHPEEDVMAQRSGGHASFGIERIEDMLAALGREPARRQATAGGPK
jgi:hypothetical protein